MRMKSFTIAAVALGTMTTTSEAVELSNTKRTNENVCVNNYCAISKEYCGEWKGATLRKIPAWGGEFSESDINF